MRGLKGCSFVIINIFRLLEREVNVSVIIWFSYVFIINKYLSSTLIRKLSWSGKHKNKRKLC